MRNWASAICFKGGLWCSGLTQNNVSLTEMGHEYFQLLLCLILGLPVSPGKHHKGGGWQLRGWREIYLRNHPRWGCFTQLCYLLLGWTVHPKLLGQVILPAFLLQLLFNASPALHMKADVVLSIFTCQDVPCWEAFPAITLSIFYSLLAKLQRGWNIRALLLFTAKETLLGKLEARNI